MSKRKSTSDIIIDPTVRPYEVLQVAMVLYDHDPSHPGNKNLKDYIGAAADMMNLAIEELRKV